MWGLLFVQIVTGLFFFTTGYRKVFVKETRAKVFGLFKRYGVPVPAGWAVVLGELLGGLSLLTGILPDLAAPLLLPIMAGALHMSVIPPLRRKWRQEKATVTLRLSNFLCTPETQLTVILIGLTLAYWL